jgi:hypothetical protein
LIMRKTPSTLFSFTRILLLAALVAAAGACARKEAKPQEDKLVTAYKLIDAQRDDEAILLLENEIAKTQVDSPYRRKLTVVLASAYAHKAGFRVQNFVKVMQVSKDNKIDFEAARTAFKSVDKAKQKTEAFDLFLGAIGVFFRNINAVTAVYAAIPTIKPEHEQYLKFALDLLDSLGDKNISQGDAMYRAVVRVIYIKNYLAVHAGEVSDSDIAVDNCQIDMAKITDKLTTLKTLGVATYTDLSLANPSKAKGYRSSSEKFANSMSSLTQVNNLASMLDYASATVIKQTLVQNGLSDLLKCPTSAQASALSSAVSSASASAGN